MITRLNITILLVIKHIFIKSLILVSIFLKGYVISIARVAEENKKCFLCNTVAMNELLSLKNAGA